MKTFGIMSTLGFAFVALAFGQGLGFGVVTTAMGADALRSTSDGASLAMALLVGIPVQVVTLVLAARMTGEDLFAYFALDIPRQRDIAISVAGLAALIFASDVLMVAMGHGLTSPSELEIHRSARSEGALLSLWVAMIVAMPVGEEILFRGFLFRGFIHEPSNALPGILAISLLWALVHVQSDWLGTALVFVIGAFLGYVRLWSGSTTLVILLHMLLNLESVAETVFMLGWA